MSKALEGMHYCKEHQGNHSHYATENCEVCRLRAEVVSLKELNKLDKEVHSKMPELVGEIAHLTQQLAAVNSERDSWINEWKTSNKRCEELVGRIALQQEQLAAANGLVERLVAAATPVLRNELDKVEVHPCDYNDDAARARQCTAEVQELLAALSALPKQVKSE